MPSDFVQVWFHMSGGPADAVGMPAERLAPDRVRLLDSPWAALNAAKGDVFHAELDAHGDLWAQHKVESSGYCAIRILLADDSPLGGPSTGVHAILEKFTPLGVTGSGMFGLVVIDVPPDADLHLVRQVLDTGQSCDWWSYDELCVTDAWEAMKSP